jgi:hypothetical protein
MYNESGANKRNWKEVRAKAKGAKNAQTRLLTSRVL